MYERYDYDERNRMLHTLTDGQREYLLEGLKRGRKTAFANALAFYKADRMNLFTGEREVEDLDESALNWEFVDFIDAGRPSPDLLCECGRMLRYQYIVKNTTSGNVLKFGKNHFEEHTGLPAKIVKEVIEGLNRIDYELDEILWKIENGYTSQSYPNIGDIIEHIPQNILLHFELNLPLLDRQEKLLFKIINNIRLEQYKEKEKTSTRVTITSPSDENYDLFSAADLPIDELGSREVGEPKQVAVLTEIIEELPAAYLSGADLYDMQTWQPEEQDPLEFKLIRDEEINWQKRMDKLIAAEKKNIYLKELHLDCMELIDNGISSVNAIVHVLLNREEYRQLFVGFSERMCYRLVVKRLTEFVVGDNPRLLVKGCKDRQDSYYYFICDL